MRSLVAQPAHRRQLTVAHRSGSTCAFNWAKPTGSRAASTTRRLLRWPTSHCRDRRTTSALAKASSPLCTVPRRVTPVADATQMWPSSPHRRGQAAAGDASHRSCQLVPGNPDSHIRMARAPATRYQRVVLSAVSNGGPCTAARTSSTGLHVMPLRPGLAGSEPGACLFQWTACGPGNKRALAGAGRRRAGQVPNTGVHQDPPNRSSRT